MRIKKLYWNNVGPYGNKIQTIEFPDSGGLWMVLGKNGNGKCHSKDTKLTVNITDESIRKRFLDFIKK